MPSINFIALCIALAPAKIATDRIFSTNTSDDFYPIIADLLNDYLPSCKSSQLCYWLEKLRGDRTNPKLAIESSNDQSRQDRTGLQTRSYYSGYGGNPVGPTIYPAIDTVSVLASLAFLAFLLHSFASLFDRSRSIIPSIVSSRDTSGERDLPDPVKLVLRALDEYDMLSTNDVQDGRKRDKKIL